MSEDFDLYDLLGLPRDAGPEEIRRAYHQAARRLHPDVNTKPGETELFLRAQEAYEILSNPEKRSEYDAQLPPDEEKTAPVTLDILYSRSSLSALAEPQLMYALLELSAPSTGSSPTPEARPALNLSIVLDRSTSMKGERMDMVKAAAQNLLNQLRPDDFFSLIVFSDRAETLISAGRQKNLKEISSQIRMIQTGGGTEIFQGLDLGLREVRRNLSNNFINHILLLTDGRTYGDEEACLEAASQAATDGIGITCLGIGEEWNDKFLDELSARTGGSSDYVSNATDIKNILQKKFHHLSQTYAEQVELEIHCGSGVDLGYVYRVAPEPSPLPVASPIHLGNLPREDQLAVLIEFLVLPLPSQGTHSDLATGQLSMNIPAKIPSNLSMQIDFSRPVGGNSWKESAPAKLLRAASQVSLYRLQEKVQVEVAGGQVEQASQHLLYLATQLLSQGNRDLAQTALLEVDHLNHTRTFSSTGEKQIKYGTRSLMLPAGSESD